MGAWPITANDAVAKPAGNRWAEVHAFLEAAGKMLHERFGFEPAAPVNNGHIVAGAPVNIEQRLKDMVYRGPEDRSIHQTQLQCIGALLRNNTRLDDAVAMVLEATRQAVANDPSWNWQEEEHNLIRMGFDLITKAPELAPCLNDKHYEMWQAATARCGPARGYRHRSIAGVPYFAPRRAMLQRQSPTRRRRKTHP